MESLFKSSKSLSVKIDSFIDLIVESGFQLRAGIKSFLKGDLSDFNERLREIEDIEKKGDIIRKDVEAQLYIQILIPESRGDVLGLLESMDEIFDRAKSTMVKFSIENPHIPDELKEHFIELTKPVKKSVEALSFAVRAFFYDVNAVKDHLHIVKLYEKDADRLSENLLRKIFSMDIELGRKLHLKSFIRHIDEIADYAEAVANRLSIATIKRIL